MSYMYYWVSFFLSQNIDNNPIHITHIECITGSHISQKNLTILTSLTYLTRKYYWVIYFVSEKNASLMQVLQLLHYYMY